MRKPLYYLTIVLIFKSTLAYEEERSFLDDKFLPLFRAFRTWSSDLLEMQDQSPRNFRRLGKSRKLQEVPVSMPFPCDLNIPQRSKEVPTSAHQVRPGDIDVIGAMGDSLTAGFGVMAANLLAVAYQNRGKSFSIGGEGRWNTYLTLPNMLKEFNPNLIGYSLDSLSTNRKSQFNVAEGGAVSNNMPYMAKILVKRIKSDRRVDVEKNWKMITHFIGDNDFCSEICYYKNPELLLKKHQQDLIEVLRILRDNLPRTIVNIIPAIQVKVLTEMYDKPELCRLTHLVECPCFIGLPNRHKRQKLVGLMTRWQTLDIEVSNYPEFDKDDFTVIPHRFTLNYTFPNTPEGGFDYSYLSEDCFHFSQKGHARFANDLWNSIMEPFGKKSSDGNTEFTKFNCPTQTHPYIFTRRNS